MYRVSFKTVVNTPNNSARVVVISEVLFETINQAMAVARDCWGSPECVEVRIVKR